MLTGKEFWHLIEHIIPVYVTVFLGWYLYRFKYILPVHAPGISRFVSLMGIPFYAFHLLAFNDPYQISLRLVGADILQKAVALLIGILYWAFAKNGKIDHVINFFMLATLPNTVLIGDALLDPLYGNIVDGKVVTIIFLQVVLWYNLTIALYEMRIVLKEMQAQSDTEDAAAVGISTSHRSARAVSIGVVDKDDYGTKVAEKSGVTSYPDLSAAVLERTLSAPARVSISKVADIFTLQQSFSGSIPKVDEGTSMEDFPASQDAHDTRPYDPFSLISGEPPNGRDPEVGREGHEQSMKDKAEQHSGVVGVVDPEAQRKPQKRKMNYFRFSTVVAYKVFNRLKYVPLTFASLLGFVYSMFAYKYHWTMPYYVQTSVELTSNGAVGMAIFILGMTWAMSGKLIACGWKKMTYGMLVRFIVGPFIMIVAALVLRLKGDNYRFAVLQAVIPQGVISFVLAKEYNLDVNEFSTAVVFQLLVFIPVVIVYYLVLGAV
ncbi:unnamed protein product [Calypogeia fissa]